MNMLTKTATSFLLFTLTGSAIADSDINIIPLTNDTQCLVTYQGPKIVKVEKIKPLPVFSFYYTNPADKDSLTYYNMLDSFQTGNVALGPSPDTNATNVATLGFSPSPNYKTGMLTAINTPANADIIQFKNKQLPHPGPDLPCMTYQCIGVEPTDPCKNLAE